MAKKKTTAPKKQPEQTEQVKKGVVSNCSKVRFRKTPESTPDNVIDILDAGKGVIVLESDGEWTKVKVGKFEGYIMTQYIEVR